MSTALPLATHPLAGFTDAIIEKTAKNIAQCAGLDFNRPPPAMNMPDRYDYETARSIAAVLSSHFPVQSVSPPTVPATHKLTEPSTNLLPTMDHTTAQQFQSTTREEDGENNSLSASAIQQQINNASRYKTELCRPFKETGYCKYGEKCQFAHGTGDLRPMNRHPKYKTELCLSYWGKNNVCSYGSRCNFLHSETGDQLETIRKPVSPPRPEMEIGTFDVNSVTNIPRSSAFLRSTETSPTSSIGDSPPGSIIETPSSSPTWIENNMVMPTHSPTHQAPPRSHPIRSPLQYYGSEITSAEIEFLALKFKSAMIAEELNKSKFRSELFARIPQSAMSIDIDPNNNITPSRSAVQRNLLDCYDLLPQYNKY